MRTQRPKPARLRAAVRRVLGDATYRTRAAALAAEMAEHGGPSEAVELLERLVATGAPVLRGRVPVQAPDAVAA
jgi:UDP:flavonoid glycosyltransferase YjiC (YdhE family)